MISYSKKLKTKNTKPITQIIIEKTYCLHIKTLNKPNLTTKVLKNHPNTTIITSHFDKIITSTTQILINKKFQIYNNNNILNTKLNNTLKNIITIATKITTNLKFNNNTKSLLVTQNLTEIHHLKIYINTNPITFTNITNINNLIITYTNPLNQNHQIKHHLTQNQNLNQIHNKIKQVTKNINTTKITIKLNKKLNIFIPITKNIHQLIYEQHSTFNIIKNLISIQTTYKINQPIIL